eukprot:Gb_23955 [translate_table: standard]
MSKECKVWLAMGYTSFLVKSKDFENSCTNMSWAIVMAYFMDRYYHGRGYGVSHKPPKMNYLDSGFAFVLTIIRCKDIIIYIYVKLVLVLEALEEIKFRRLHSQALTLAALTGAALVEYYEHRHVDGSVSSHAQMMGPGCA